jgi:hypothetical protein
MQLDSDIFLKPDEMVTRPRSVFLNNVAPFPPQYVQGLYCHDTAVCSLVCEYGINKPLEDDYGRNSLYLASYPLYTSPSRYFELGTLQIRSSYVKQIRNLWAVTPFSVMIK